MPWTTIEFGEAQIEPGKPRKPLKAGIAPWERMNFSAVASSSSVVMPGRTFDSTIFMQRTRMSPAAAILSTCSGVLRTIIRYTLYSLVLLQTHRRQGAPDLLGDLVGTRLAGDPAQDAALVVVVHQGLGLGVVLLEAVADHLRLVVVADDQRRGVEIADALPLRRGEVG